MSSFFVAVHVGPYGTEWAEPCIGKVYSVKGKNG